MGSRTKLHSCAYLLVTLGCRIKKSLLLRVPVEPELKGAIERAAEETLLSQADVIRAALRIGAPEVAKRLRMSKRPRRDLMDYLDAFRGPVSPGVDTVKER